MSLTTFMRLPRIRDAFDKFAAKIRTPKEFKGRPILVHDSGGPKGLAGTAFDYMVRIEIARVFHQSDVVVHQQEWISELIRKKIWDRDNEDDEGTFCIDHPYFWRPQLDEAHAAAHAYIKGNGCALCLATQTQYMAQADFLYRTRFDFDDYFNASGRVAQELTALLKHFDPQKLFNPQQKVILNPHFALSDKVDGADGDLIVDDRLIDFKTTKRLSFSKSYLMQLTGYAVLHDLGGTKIDSGIDQSPIKQIGVYFSRHDALVEIPLDELFPDNGYEQFKAIFEDEMNTRAAERQRKLKEFEDRSAQRMSAEKAHA